MCFIKIKYSPPTNSAKCSHNVHEGGVVLLIMCLKKIAFLQPQKFVQKLSNAINLTPFDGSPIHTLTLHLQIMGISKATC